MGRGRGGAKKMAQTIKTREEFKDALKDAGDKLVVVFFCATWCPACQRIGPQWEKERGSLSGAVHYGVDINENEATVEYYNVTKTPTFILFKNGLKVERYVGTDLDVLKSTIARHL
jgi:thiol-disulfide isomerase/thioredoxin